MERGHQIDIRNVAFFRHDYDSEHADMQAPLRAGQDRPVERRDRYRLGSSRSTVMAG